MSNIVTRRIEEHPVEGKPLGRHVHHDSASRQFEAEQATKLRAVTHVQVGSALPLDQARGSCTAEALCGARNMNPDHRQSDAILYQPDADKLYDQEIRAQGGDPVNDDPGGTGLLVCKCAKTDGLISSYTHTFSLEAALKALVLRPVMFGTNWYEGFDSPDRNGLVTISGQIRGGHEYVARALDPAAKIVGLWNSWGTQFGHGGRFYMTFGTLGRLLSEQGDCTVPIR